MLWKEYYYGKTSLPLLKDIFYDVLEDLDSCTWYLKHRLDYPILFQPWLTEYIYSKKISMFLRYKRMTVHATIWEIGLKPKQKELFSWQNKKKKKRYHKKKTKGPENLLEYWK